MVYCRKSILKKTKTTLPKSRNTSAICECTSILWNLPEKNGRKIKVDGFGGEYFMDDANIPSLLSLPYLGYVKMHDPYYLVTREKLLSAQNPYFFNGTQGHGIGGPHEGLNMIWPMSIIMQALTTHDENEIKTCLDILEKRMIDHGFMYESFHAYDPTRSTRPWFAWANSLFGELIMTLIDEKPHLLF